MTNRPPSHVLESVSRTRLRQAFENRGWTVQELQNDYGEDLLVRIFDQGKATPLEFYVQAKSARSTDRFRKRTAECLAFPVDLEHLRHWLTFWQPVILTVWDEKRQVTYWECVQTAVERAERRRLPRRGSKTATVRIPLQNTIDSRGIQQIYARTTAMFGRFRREREGAKHLTDALRELLGLDIDYDPQYGILAVPEGKFVPAAQGGSHARFFGRAARDMGRISSTLGISTQQAFDLSTGMVLEALQSLLRGQPAVFRAPTGEIVEIWRTIAEANSNYHRLTDLLDDDMA